jgi:hypothetical protein
LIEFVIHGLSFGFDAGHHGWRLLIVRRFRLKTVTAKGDCSLLIREWRVWNGRLRTPDHVNVPTTTAWIFET